MFNFFKKNSNSHINFEPILLDDPTEVLKEELSHYPNHVLVRALIMATRLIVLMDPNEEFIIKKNALKKFKEDDSNDLAKRFVKAIFSSYLDNKVEIDNEIKMRIH